MGITVHEALKIGGLRYGKVIAGLNGMNRQIEHVTVLEVPDIIQWLKGGELILTSGFAISKDEGEQITLIRELATKGASALVIKTQRFLDLIPKAMLEAANKYELPLVELEHNISYIDIIRPIITEIITRETASFQRQLTEIAIAGGGIEQRLSVLSEHIKNPIAILDKMGNILAESPKPWFKVTSIIEKIKNSGLISETSTIYEDMSYHIFPLIIEGCVEGYLVLGELFGKIEENILLLVKGTLSIFNIDLLQRKTLKDIVEGFRSDFLEDLLLGHIKSESVAQRRANFLGYPTEGNFLIVVISREPKLNEKQIMNFQHKFMQNLDSIFNDEKLTIVEAIEGKNIVLLVHLKKVEEFTTNLIELQAILKDIRFGAFTMGIGEIFTNLIETRKSFLEATEALEFGIEFWGEGSCTFFSDIGIYRLLWIIKDNAELEHYIPQGLLQLKKYDTEQNTELLKTLEKYLKNAGNSKKTAAEMFIHYKTLQYRLERINEISGMDLNSGESRLELHLGLKILDICSKRGSC